MNKRLAIIVAGGTGERMRAMLPKQFLPLGDNSVVLMQTIHKLHTYSPKMKIILVLPTGATRIWAELCKKHHFDIHLDIIEGGKSRFESVKKALHFIQLQNIDPNTCVAIHDGVRPFVSKKLWQNIFDEASTNGNAVPAVAITDTLRMKGYKGRTTTVDRNNYLAVQTPQVFRLDMLTMAFKQKYTKQFTDDSSVVERAGIQINIIPGEPENFKITTNWDYQKARLLFLNK